MKDGSTNLIPLAKPHFTEEEIKELRDTLNSGWVAQGPKVKQFEEKVRKYLDVGHCIAVNSCTTALYLTLSAYGIGPGDKVIIPDFTYMATGNVVLHIGAEPIIVDIDPATLCIDPNQIKENIDEKVKAIIPLSGAKVKATNQVFSAKVKANGYVGCDPL